MNTTSWLYSAAMMRACARLIVLAISIGFAVHQSSAALFVLSDDNSSANFETETLNPHPASPVNNVHWLVDGVDQLREQAFWFRVGNTDERSLHNLPVAGQVASNTNFDPANDTLFVRYNGPGFQADMRYVLDGGAPGSGASDITEQISITNVTAAPLDFHFFQFTDFNVQGTPGGDSGVFTNPNAVDQFEGNVLFTETIVTPVPSHRELDFFPNTRVKLNDAVASTLSDTPPYGVVLGPGDLTWAYQWDVVIQPGFTFQISKDKRIAPVPEPGLVSLLSLAAVALIAAYRRRPAAS